MDTCAPYGKGETMTYFGQQDDSGHVCDDDCRSYGCKYVINMLGPHPGESDQELEDASSSGP